MNFLSKNFSRETQESQKLSPNNSAKKLQKFFRNKILPIVFAGSVAVSANAQNNPKPEDTTPNFEKEKPTEVVKQKKFANPSLGENKKISKLLKIGKD